MPAETSATRHLARPTRAVLPIRRPQLSVSSAPAGASCAMPADRSAMRHLARLAHPTRAGRSVGATAALPELPSNLGQPRVEIRIRVAVFVVREADHRRAVARDVLGRRDLAKREERACPSLPLGVGRRPVRGPGRPRRIVARSPAATEALEPRFARIVHVSARAAVIQPAGAASGSVAAGCSRSASA